MPDDSRCPDCPHVAPLAERVTALEQSHRDVRAELDRLRNVVRRREPIAVSRMEVADEDLSDEPLSPREMRAIARRAAEMVDLLKGS